MNMLDVAVKTRAILTALDTDVKRINGRMEVTGFERSDLWITLVVECGGLNTGIRVLINSLRSGEEFWQMFEPDSQKWLDMRAQGMGALLSAVEEATGARRTVLFRGEPSVER